MYKMREGHAMLDKQYTLLLVLSVLQMHTTENMHKIVEQDHIDV